MKKFFWRFLHANVVNSGDDRGECCLSAVFFALLQSNQVKRTPQESVNEFIIQKVNPWLVVDFRLISAFLYV